MEKNKEYRMENKAKTEEVLTSASKIRTFKDLYAWREAHQLVLLTYKLTKSFPKDELFGLVSQMRRAAVSITSNIAEGFGRASFKEKSQFYSISQGSVTELQNQLIISKDVGYISAAEFGDADRRAQETHRIIHGLRQGAKKYFSCALFFILASLFWAAPLAHAATLTRPPNNLGLAGYWSFDEGTGTKAVDHTGNGGNGILSNGPIWTVGRHGHAVAFDGVTTNQGVFVPSSSTFDPGTSGSLSVAIWFNSSVATGNALIKKKANGAVGNPGWSIRFRPSDGNTFQFNVSDGTTQVSNQFSLAPYVDGRWHEVVSIIDRGSQNEYTYIDGVLKDADSIATITGSVSSGQSVVIGDDGSTNIFNGSLDDARIYTRALSATEVAGLYQKGEVVVNHSQNIAVPNGLVGMWSFDNADLNWTSATAGTALDRSGNNNTGTLTSMNLAKTPVIGKIGQALNFDGGTTNVSVANVASLQLSQGTLSAWIKTSNAGTNYRGIVVKSLAYGMYLQGNVFGIYDNGAATFRSTGVSLNDNRWHHVVEAFNSGVTNGTFLYIDGNLVLTTTMTNTLQTQVVRIGMGQGGAPQTFTGAIDDARIYNRMLSATEVKELYLTGSSVVNKSSTNLQANTSLASGLVGLWTFDGPDVTDKVYDRSGQGNNGYFIGVATSTAKTIGKMGQALAFNGTSGYVNAGNNSSLNITGSYAVSAWTKFTTTPASGRFIVSKSEGGTNGYELFQSTTNKLRFSMQASSGTADPYFDISTPALYNDGKWHHVVGVYDIGVKAYIYVDGVLVVTSANNPSAAVPISTSNLFIGARGSTGTQVFNGSLDDVRLYSRALSAAEVKQLYLMGK